MLSKSELLSILVKLEDNGLDINPYMTKLLSSSTIPTEVLQFVAKNQGLEVSNFYEMLRHKHNKNKSPLYTNILKDGQSVEDTITTLTCLLTQVILYSNKLEDKEHFLKEARAEEITRVLNTYFKTYEAAGCLALMKLIKSDLLVSEYISGKRELA